jgi:hypothetical protein
MDKVFLRSSAAIARYLRRDVEPDGIASQGALFVLCDNRNLVLAHCHVDEIPPDLDCGERDRMVSLFAHLLAEGGDGALVLALTRPGWVQLTAADICWFWAARRACAMHEVRLLGVYLVTPRGHREVVLDDAL